MSTARPITFELADPERHAALLHDWFHQPHVLPWWGPERTAQETHAYLVRQCESGHLTPWIVSAGDLRFGYVETYRAAEDPLADHFPLYASDRGWHVLVGPPEVIGSGLPRLMGRTLLSRLFADPEVHRVVCEPDERNGRMLAYCRALGYQELGTVDLPDKRAVIFGMSRAAYEQAGDATVAAS